MLTTEEWIDGEVASDMSAMYAGDGCHPEEGQALKDYLSGKASPEEASHNLVAQILSKEVPRDEIYRVWALLSGALVETEERDRTKMYELIGAIQQVPEHDGIDFKSLSGFHSMWDTLYRMFYHGPAEWEKSDKPLLAKTVEGFRHHYYAIGSAEAIMFARNVGNIPVEWGLAALDLVLTKDPRSLDVYIGCVHAWMVEAGDKLHESLQTMDTHWYLHREPVAIMGGLREPKSMHWDKCRSALLRIGSDGSPLSKRSKELALECYELMKRSNQA